MKKRGVSPLIISVILIGFTFVLFITFFSWSSTLTQSSFNDIDFSPSLVDFNVKWSEETYNDCEETKNNYCYVLLVENEEGFDVNYRVVTRSSKDIEVDEGYSLGAYESNLFIVHYDNSLGKDINAVVEAMS
jgi:hypothetical protein